MLHPLCLPSLNRHLTRWVAGKDSSIGCFFDALFHLHVYLHSCYIVSGMKMGRTMCKTQDEVLQAGDKADLNLRSQNCVVEGNEMLN